MDRKSKALDKFRKPYSCAQTVYAAYASDSPDDLAEMAANSGGRAERRGFARLDELCGLDVLAHIFNKLEIRFHCSET